MRALVQQLFAAILSISKSCGAGLEILETEQLRSEEMPADRVGV